MQQRVKQHNRIHIHCTTMNCGGRVPDGIAELLPMFELEDDYFEPDVYVVGLQEMVPLNAKNCLLKDTKRLELWRTMLVEALEVCRAKRISKKGHRFSDDEMFEEALVYLDRSMVGCYIAVFFKRKLAGRLKPKSLQLCRVKAGALGATGNKGAVCVRFQIDDQAVMFINCHLVSGRRRDPQRTAMIAAIFKSAFSKNKAFAIENHQQVILLGDLNYRINSLTRAEVVKFV